LIDRDLYRTPDGHWIFGVFSVRGGEFDFRGPAVDVYDLVHRSFHQLTPTGSTELSAFSGAGSGNRFYFFKSERNGESARLWAIFARNDQPWRWRCG
jgi:hypothetical protein